MTDLDYGNARLRVRAGWWLTAAGYRGLLASSSLDGLLGSLAQLNYADDVSAAMGRYQGIRRLDEAVRRHLSRQLEDVLSFYTGQVGRRLGTFLSRWDVRNVRSVLRDLAGRRQQVPGTSNLVTAGAFDARTLDEVAAQRDVRSAIDLLSVWGLPSPAVVRQLRHALPAFIESGDVLVLERALDRAFGELAIEARQERDRVSELLSREVDRINLMSMLRLRADAGQGRATTVGDDISGGTVPVQVWTDLSTIDDAGLPDAVIPRVAPTWRPALAAWFEHRDLARLDTELDHADVIEAIARFRGGDPLGIDVPLGYIGQQEAEAANLRLVGRAVAHGLDRDEAFDRLLGVVA